MSRSILPPSHLAPPCTREGTAGGGIGIGVGEGSSRGSCRRVATNRKGTDEIEQRKNLAPVVSCSQMRRGKKLSQHQIHAQFQGRLKKDSKVVEEVLAKKLDCHKCHPTESFVTITPMHANCSHFTSKKHPGS